VSLLRQEKCRLAKTEQKIDEPICDAVPIRVGLAKLLGPGEVANGLEIQAKLVPCRTWNAALMPESLASKAAAGVTRCPSVGDLVRCRWTRKSARHEDRSG
jgi:hypothetical protein